MNWTSFKLQSSNLFPHFTDNFNCQMLVLNMCEAHRGHSKVLYDNSPQPWLTTISCFSEVNYLKSKLPLVKYDSPKEILKKYRDGGVAIIDQWICAHAQYFVGTCESTFSFRIHEERDILGFHGDKTFNCLCGDKKIGKCEQPSRWRVVY